MEILVPLFFICVFYITLTILSLLLCNRYKRNNNNPPSVKMPHGYYMGEIETQLRRQTDIMERDRWDRINNYQQGDN